MGKISLKTTGFLGVMIIAFANGFSWCNLLILITFPLFFIGNPWYSIFKKD
ncbi:hypothetical protein M2M59_12295 [Rummeliibacillus sp. G93]|uniref:hypothetical protein n=1 Tax=Rummeliibacillus sp. G93 TaxID=2939494 RepID=UPI00201C1001|nr:hypothetical protein [Rummeliibacillus sp. G93]UQW96737.1 hypothetical protein M2M59_12295 [Rummeliibacillus sp. G93]